MKTTILLFFFSMLCITKMQSQDTLATKYYKTKDKKISTSEKRGVVVEYTIKDADEIIRYEMLDIATHKKIFIKRYKNKVPIGKWLYETEDDVLEKPIEFEYNDHEYQGYIKIPYDDPTTVNILKFLASEIIYPFDAKEKGIQGQVLIQFILDELGEITNFSILKGVDPELDKEVARVMLNSPRWIPVKLDGKSIKVHFIIPVNFGIKISKKNSGYSH